MLPKNNYLQFIFGVSKIMFIFVVQNKQTINKAMSTAFYFQDNWVGDIHNFDTLRQAKKEAKNHTNGHAIVIYKGGDIVAIVKPNENPLP